MTDDAKLLAEIDRWKDATSHPPYGSQHWLAWGVDLLPKARDRIADLERENKRLEELGAAMVKAGGDLIALRDALERQLADETKIVDRIWDLYGRPSYESLNGRSLVDLIAETQRQLVEGRPIPREPTIKMIAAGVDCMRVTGGDLDLWADVRDAYTAMYDAALAQPEGEHE